MMNHLWARFKGLILVTAGVLAILVWASAFIVTQSEIALLLQMGRPIKAVDTPGLFFKVPFIQNVITYDKRLIDVDLPSAEIISSDQKRLVVDSYVLYKITNPLQFYETLGTEEVARTRLQTLAGASLRRVLGNNPLANLLSQDRKHIMAQIQEGVWKAAQPFGIDVVDVRIRHADLPKANSEAIYLRMESERKREAKEFRAQGEEEARKIRSHADKERIILLANADKQSQKLRGEGESEAITLLGRIFSKDPKFFEFYRSLEAYKNALTPSTTTLVLEPSGDFFKFFKRGA